MNSTRRSRRRLVLAVAGVLALAGCGGIGTSTSSSTAAAPASSAAPSATSSSPAGAGGSATAVPDTSAASSAGSVPAGSASAPASSSAPALSGTISFWHFFTDREAAVIQKVVDQFQKENPGVTVKVSAGQDDEKVRKAIASGNSIDVGLSYSTDIVGNFCSSGAFQDLGPYITKDTVDLEQFPATVLSYTEYKGVRCSMPVLADVYALYYNKDMLKAGGFAGPPKTLTELADMAEKLTTYNDDGSIKTLGFNPLMGWYENAAAHLGPAAGAQWLKEDGTSAVGTDPGWVKLMTWQKGLLDKIGYDKVQAFSAGTGQEFSADNAFQAGKVAMNLDGEYRTAFIDDQAPKLNYGTAPFPTTDDHTDLYGGGYITGNIIGIAKNSQNPDLAWAFIKYLTTNTAAVVELSNGLKNVPTTHDALASPDLEVSPQFKTFLDVFASPHSATTPPSPNGNGYQQAFQDFWDLYQSGKVPDLAAGLADVDQQINDALTLTGN